VWGLDYQTWPGRASGLAGAGRGVL
jgi:hypothetical protein